MKIHKDFSLTCHNTLKIPSRCAYFIELETMQDVEELEHGNVSGDYVKPYKVLGSGANILFVNNYPGTILHNCVKGIRIVKQDEESITVEVAGGETWNDVVSFALAQNVGGIENLIDIPGTAGASPVSNIAAYGQNLSDVVVHVSTVDLVSQKRKFYSNEECEFKYRDSIFKKRNNHNLLIYALTLKLKKNPQINTEYWSTKYGTINEVLSQLHDPPYTINDVSLAISHIRKSKMPDMNLYGTAGSFFKNPTVDNNKLNEIKRRFPNIQYYPYSQLHYDNTNDEEVISANRKYKVSAGYILDVGMGYRGLWEGKVGLYDKHALVLITKDNATGEQVHLFSKKIKKDFFNFCGIVLEEEVEIVE